MKYTVDRIENGIAICEYDSKKYTEIPLASLPGKVKEGDILTEINGVFSVDASATYSARDEMFDLQSSVFGKKNKR